jgi:hypothetical protein
VTYDEQRFLPLYEPANALFAESGVVGGEVAMWSWIL